MMMDEIKGDLAALNIRHDVFFSERSLIESGNNRVTETIDFLRSKGDIYEGRLPPPKGGPVEDYEDREQTLFRATAFGDDVDRPLIKSDGSYTYFASDIAYHKNKFERGFHNLIDVFGADHGGYIKRMQAAVKAVTAGKATLDVKIVQLVQLLRNGEPVKMSKRSGDFVTLREVVDEVGKDAVRFMMLFRKNDAVLDFDLAKVIEQSKDNPVFYVQYGHARGHSVFRNAREVIPDLPEEAGARAAFLGDAAVERLTDPAELDLLRRLALYPRMIEAAAAAHEPHRIAFYLYDLASEFHALWTRGRDLPYLRFIINNDAEITKARLALVQGVVSVLASGLPFSASMLRTRCGSRGLMPLTWGSVRASGRGWFVCREASWRLSRRGRIITMADRYQDRPFPADDGYDRGDDRMRLQRARAIRWPSLRA